MARTINKLSAAKIATETKPGRYGDGGGLWLQVSYYGTKAWVFRFMLDGRARQMGLGDVKTFSLKEARERARQARQLVADGIDPIEAKNASRVARKAEDAKLMTFRDAAERYVKAHRAGWKNLKHAEQWVNTLATYADPVLGDLSVAAIDTSHVMKVLEPIWTEKTETASRLRGRVESVLDWATARHFRIGENPARWKGHLDKLLPPPSKVARIRHHPALPYAELPGFMERLRRMDSVSARALEFTILTAARTGETIGATREEFDLVAKVWTVPPERMKSAREHRVPLNDRAIAILNDMPRERGGQFVFPGGRKHRPLSNMAMLELLRGMDGLDGITTHGFRSTFRDWVSECTAFPSDIAEAALAHAIGDETRAAYERGDKLEKRRRLMTAWGGYCAQKPATGGKVIALKGGHNG